MGSTDDQRWARVPPGKAWKHPGLPQDWCPVRDENPDSVLHTRPDPGYVWVEVAGRLCHLWAAHLEFRDVEPE